MMRSRWFLLLPIVVASGSAHAEVAMRLGINTHFDQGWPITALGEVAAAQANSIRDTINWGKVEQAPGVYSFTSANSGFAGRACATKVPMLLTLTPRNKIYDNGETVFSPQGRQAFAVFAAEVARRFPCVYAFEIGNEINGHSLKGRMVQQMPGSYVAVIREVRAALMRQRSSVKLLSGSSLSVATGFFDRLFGAGLLPFVDGVVVHPYLAVPEQLPDQIERLQSAMRRHGGSKPIWATEFGFYYQTPDDAPPHSLKLITLMSAAGIEEADWYALREEKYYPNMGLFDGGKGKPAFDTFRMAVQRLLSGGDARRIDVGDPLTFIYRYSNGAYVMWGGGRTISWKGSAKARDARGRDIVLPSRLNADPVVIEAPGGFHLGAPFVIADTLTDFTGAGWSYMAARPNSNQEPFGWIDWNWTPYLGTHALPNFRAMGAVVTTARPNRGPVPELIERYNAATPGRYFVSACFEAKAARPQSVRIVAGGREIYTGKVSGVLTIQPIPVSLGAGQALDVVYKALLPGGPQALRRRIRILTQPGPSSALCAPKGRGTDIEGGI